MTDETPAHGCTINGQPAMPILISEYNQLTAQAARLESAITEQERLAAELADYDQRVEQLTAALARVQAIADEHPAGIDTALILEALDQHATEPHTGLVVQPYRNDHGQPRWVFRCWGTDTCDGWLSLDHHTQQSAQRARDRHVTEEHTTPAPAATPAANTHPDPESPCSVWA